VEDIEGRLARQGTDLGQARRALTATVEQVQAAIPKNTALIEYVRYSGEARAGEGVMGLRRGFIEAGAQNLLMTLWPISDEVTVQIMSDFYGAAHQSGNAPEALAKVQRD
jgi:hypothetical protein